MNTTLFVNRDEELSFIQEYLSSEKTGFLPIYGRRRIGKTTLIKEALTKNSLYFLAKKTSIKDNLQNFQKNIKEILNLKQSFNFESFEEIFEFLKTTNKDFTIVIDEFPYLCELDSSIPSRFQYILDEITKSSKIKLILMGSSIAMMEKEVLSYKSPLYGRRIGNIRLLALKFKYLKEFFPQLNLEDLIKVYAIVGGVPYYLENLRGKNFDEIVKTIFNKHSIFYEEVDYLLREELKEPKNFKLILQAIVRGNNKFSELSSLTGIDKSALSYYLDILENLKFIKKEIPYFESIKTKKTQYSINDEFISFWFAFINSYQNKIEIENYSFLKEFETEFNTYLGKVFEKVVKEFLEEKEKKKFKRQWGTYLGLNRRNKTYEIDLVNLDNKSNLLSLVEIKWSDNVNASLLLKNLKEKCEYLPKKSKNKQFILVAKSFKESKKELQELKEEKIKIYTLNDIENF